VFDRFNRNIDYLRISVTDRCNLRCRYCMPEEGIKLLSHEDILTFDEITDFTKVAVGAGIKKVRITGGEPLVRKGIVSLVSMLASIKGIEDLSMTTNGALLKRFAKELFKAGLQRINISLDTLDPVKYEYITRGGNLKEVLSGIEAVKETGMIPVKINCVIREPVKNNDLLALESWCRSLDLEIRYITQMDLKHGSFSVVEGGSGGNCSVCNRLRLTANGKLIPCLFSDLEFDIRKSGYVEAITEALELKPECGSFNNKGNFYNIGG
jgi:GTP 3',8-cyclase